MPSSMLLWVPSAPLQMRPLLTAVLLVVAAHVGCASNTPRDEDGPADPTGAPFIKLANRNLALAMYWRGPVADEAYVEQLERRLARRLGATYQTRVVVRRVLKPFSQIAPELFLDLVENDVDDVVIAEVETLERPDGPLKATATVVTMADQRIAYRTEIKRLASKRKGRPAAKRLADLLVRKIGSGWTDPGAGPKLDRLAAADKLADRDACDQAVKIYDRVFKQLGPSAFTEMTGVIDSEQRYKKCQRRLAVRDAIERDKKAKFEVTVESAGTSQTLTSAFSRALAKSALLRQLAKATDKPVKIVVAPTAITVELRFHPDRYRKAIRGREQYVHEQPVVYVDPYIPVIDGILEFRTDAVDLVAPYDRQTLRTMSTALRLTTLSGDYVEIIFADADDRLLIDDAMRVRVGSREEISVPSSEPRVTRNQRFVLGPPRSPAGDITAYGLIFDFFGLDGGSR